LVEFSLNIIIKKILVKQKEFFFHINNKTKKETKKSIQNVSGVTENIQT